MYLYPDGWGLVNNKRKTGDGDLEPCFSQSSFYVEQGRGITGIALEMNCRPKHLRANTALNYITRSFFPSAPLKVRQHFAKNQ
jgi:hypothetical protein